MASLAPHKESGSSTPQHGADRLSANPLSPAWDPSSRTPRPPMESFDNNLVTTEQHILASFHLQPPPEPKPGEQLIVRMGDVQPCTQESGFLIRDCCTSNWISASWGPTIVSCIMHVTKTNVVSSHSARKSSPSTTRSWSKWGTMKASSSSRFAISTRKPLRNGQNLLLVVLPVRLSGQSANELS
jgi:hypothetical protein